MEYEKWIKVFSDMTIRSKTECEVITCRSYARLMFDINYIRTLEGRILIISYSTKHWLEKTLVGRFTRFYPSTFCYYVH